MLDIPSTAPRQPNACHRQSIHGNCCVILLKCYLLTYIYIVYGTEPSGGNGYISTTKSSSKNILFDENLEGCEEFHTNNVFDMSLQQSLDLEGNPHLGGYQEHTRNR